jgi:hypothetical protein
VVFTEKLLNIVYNSHPKDKCQADPEFQQQYVQQCSGKPSSEREACAKNIMMACMSKDESIKKLCGSNNVGECLGHYANTCGWD